MRKYMATNQYLLIRIRAPFTNKNKVSHNAFLVSLLNTGSTSSRAESFHTPNNDEFSSTFLRLIRNLKIQPLFLIPLTLPFADRSFLPLPFPFPFSLLSSFRPFLSGQCSFSWLKEDL